MYRELQACCISPRTTVLYIAQCVAPYSKIDPVWKIVLCIRWHNSSTGVHGYIALNGTMHLQVYMVTLYENLEYRYQELQACWISP